MQVNRALDHIPVPNLAIIQLMLPSHSPSITPAASQVRIVNESLSAYPELLYAPSRTEPTAGLSSGAVAMGAAVDSALQRLKERGLGGGGGPGALRMDVVAGPKVSYAGACLGVTHSWVGRWDCMIFTFGCIIIIIIIITEGGVSVVSGIVRWLFPHWHCSSCTSPR